MTHADQIEYSGSWSLEKKNGRGTLTSPSNTVITRGVFVDNVQSDDAFILPTTTMSEGSVIDFGTVALRMRDDIPSHIVKIASTFDWKEGDRFVLNFNWVGAQSERLNDIRWGESKFPVTVNRSRMESDSKVAHQGCGVSLPTSRTRNGGQISLGIVSRRIRFGLLPSKCK
jgi:hypothetical protein